MAESNSDEKKKVEGRLSALTSEFQQLQDTSQRRMARLKQALQDATDYERLCDKFEAWLSGAEGQMKSMAPFSMLSQPLKTQLEKVEVCWYREEAIISVCLSYQVTLLVTLITTFVFRFFFFFPSFSPTYV